jgi:hypothetical protein
MNELARPDNKSISLGFLQSFRNAIVCEKIRGIIGLFATASHARRASMHLTTSRTLDFDL